MANVTQSAHDRLVRETAERYIRQGFSVDIEPLQEDLPDFLQRFRPDLIVTTPEGKIVVEVKYRGKVRRVEYFKELGEAISAHPGWTFQLVVDNKREEELAGIDMPVLTEEEVRTRLEASQQLADQGLLDSALVMAWSNLEAVLRAESRAEGLSLTNQGSGPLITALYSEGSLEEEDYETLRRILSARNQAAHGFRLENMDRSQVEQIQDMTRRLLSQERKAA